MTVSVLVVDDSGFFRRRLSEIISSSAGLKVIGTASNGREAIEQTLKLKPDVITMDYEMPVMNGVVAVREIMRQHPTPILMFSSLTFEGARVTLDSLEAGAVDYLPKNFEEISKSSSVLKQKLSDTLLAISNTRNSGALGRIAKPTTPITSAEVGAEFVTSPVRQPAAQIPAHSSSRSKKHYRLIAIGTSTGGPVALQDVLKRLPEDFSVPIVLIQHMPSTFTPAFAERLNGLCKIRVVEAKDGDKLLPGLALLAPGGKQLLVSNNDMVKVYEARFLCESQCIPSILRIHG